MDAGRCSVLLISFLMPVVISSAISAASVSTVACWDFSGLFDSGYRLSIIVLLRVLTLGSEGHVATL